MIAGGTVWRTIERSSGQTEKPDPRRVKELYLLAQWVTGGWGRNTTGEGPVRPEREKEIITPWCRLLDRVFPNCPWATAGKPIQEITQGTLGEKGECQITEGDGVLWETDIQYSFQAVNLHSLDCWLRQNGPVADPG
jgi:hypothetical protein